MDNIKQSNTIRDIILNTRKPIVFRKFSTHWTCFNCSLDDWCQKLDDNYSQHSKPQFEQMPTTFGDIPQWERYRSHISTSFTNFIQKHCDDSDNWTAFHYEPSSKIPFECRHDIDFGCFGFSDPKNQEASFWLSSKGANTPCHYDTYGCNIVVQVKGRKQWLLFPPQTKLTPVRVPYEESSVYCAENFYSPKSLDTFSVSRKNAFECILDEGDVLIVPRNWWHYVESLETSLSVNMWIPLKIDVDAQIEECIVKYIVENTLRQETEESRHFVLNPNQLQQITPTDDLFQILHILVNEKLCHEQIKEKHSYEYLTEEDVNEIIEKSVDNVTVLQQLSPNEFDKLILEKTKRYVDMEPPDINDIHPMHEALLNAICHPNVIKNIKDEFLKQHLKK